MITTTAFWVGTAERGVKTFCQAFLAVAFLSVGADAIGTTAGVADIGWVEAVSVAATATIFSVITSVGNASFTAGAPAAENGAGGVYHDDIPLQGDDIR